MAEKSGEGDKNADDAVSWNLGRLWCANTRPARSTRTTYGAKRFRFVKLSKTEAPFNGIFGVRWAFSRLTVFLQQVGKCLEIREKCVDEAVDVHRDASDFDGLEFSGHTCSIS